MAIFKTSSGQVLHLVMKRVGVFTGNGCNTARSPFEGSWCKCAYCGSKHILTTAQRSYLRRGRDVAYFTCGNVCQLKLTQKLFNAEIGKENAHKISAWRLAHWEGVSTHYRKINGRHEHRTVAEKKYGRKLTFDDVVHHIDGNKRNNHPDNLVVLTRAEHCHAHDFGRKNGS